MKIEQEQTELTEGNHLPERPKKFSDKEPSVVSVISCLPRRSWTKAG
jgi:hypothetical protein